MYIFGNQSFSRILECEISIRNVIMLDQDIINVIRNVYRMSNTRDTHGSIKIHAIIIPNSNSVKFTVYRRRGCVGLRRFYINGSNLVKGIKG